MAFLAKNPRIPDFTRNSKLFDKQSFLTFEEKYLSIVKDSGLKSEPIHLYFTLVSLFYEFKSSYMAFPKHQTRSPFPHQGNLAPMEKIHQSFKSGKLKNRAYKVVFGEKDQVQNAS